MKMEKSKEIRVNNIGNYYGNLLIKQEGGKCWWVIEDYTAHDWREIPRELFEALLRYNQDSHVVEDQREEYPKEGEGSVLHFETKKSPIDGSIIPTQVCYREGCECALLHRRRDNCPRCEAGLCSEHQPYQALREESLGEAEMFTINEDLSSFDHCIWVHFITPKKYADAWRALLDNQKE